MADIILQLSQIEKSFGNSKVLNGIDLSVRKGEFITLLGPSGCGKTTTLRIIAGLETPDKGRVLIAGKDVTGEEPNKRNVNMVFQNYALFPHMNVEQNIGYSLRLKRINKEVINKTVVKALELVQLEGFEKRMPGGLSGGQQQRVAIARAIVNRPALLLLDEPLGALDLQLRRQMQTELKRLQKRLGVTFIYITHDQEEALNMSDSIAVMRNGRFEQIGTPSEVYDRPRTSYVATFVGSANIIRGTASTADSELVAFQNENGTGIVSTRGANITKGQSVTIAVRREMVNLIPNRPAHSQGFPAVVHEKNFAGGVLQVTVTLADGSELVSSRQGIDLPFAPGDRVIATWLPDHAALVDLEDI
ncbi:MAG: ABC transporter ATP-binding protein [Bacillota bacterium]|jgi:spermidine/putrescine transport system ATP-binding protein